MKLNLKKEGPKVLAGIIFVVLLLMIIRYFQLEKWNVIILLGSINLFFMLIVKFRTKAKFQTKEFIKNILYIIVLINIMHYMGRFGAKGYIISIILICGSIIIRRRKKWLSVKHHIETMLFGKPLFKYREEGKKPPTIGLKL